jgi:predicted glycoside hydrolase/deacetylase ChbG (UPF0249 family)
MDEKLRRKIVITADDFGISEKANVSILKLAKAGKLDRVAVIPHGIFTGQEIGELIGSGIKIDAHLNITEDILGKRKIKENVIKGMLAFLLSLFLGRINKKKTRDLWERDVKNFKEKFKRNPDGINSHQHVHFSSKYLKIALDLMEKYDIKFIRFGKKSLLGDKNKVKNILGVLRKKNKKIFFESGQESTDYFVSLDWVKNPNYFFQNIPNGTVELVCHPEREEEFKFIETMF